MLLFVGWHTWHGAGDAFVVGADKEKIMAKTKVAAKKSVVRPAVKVAPKVVVKKATVKPTVKGPVKKYGLGGFISEMFSSPESKAAAMKAKDEAMMAKNRETGASATPGLAVKQEEAELSKQNLEQGRTLGAGRTVSPALQRK